MAEHANEYLLLLFYLWKVFVMGKSIGMYLFPILNAFLHCNWRWWEVFSASKNVNTCTVVLLKWNSITKHSHNYSHNIQLHAVRFNSLSEMNKWFFFCQFFFSTVLLWTISKNEKKLQGTVVRGVTKPIAHI